MKSWSLANRIISSVLAVVIISLLALGVAIGFFTHHEMIERLDNSLQEVSERLQSAIVTQLHAAPTGTVAVVPGAGAWALAYQIVDPEGHVVLRSQNAPVQAFVWPAQAGFADTQHFRVYVAVPDATSYRVMIGEPMRHRHGAIRRAMIIHLLPIPIFIPVIWLLVRLTVRRALQPLDRLNAEMQSRGSGNLSPVPPLDLPVELISIQTSLNTLLLRLEKALATERAFAASAAHELRNPIAALQAQIQLLEASLAPGSAMTARVQVIAGRTRQLGRTVEKLLQFSRAMSGVAFRRERFDLLPVLYLLLDDMDNAAKGPHRVKIEVGDIEGIFVYGDIDATGILFRNLIENALVHGAGEGCARIRLRDDGTVDIANDCPPLPQPVLTRLTNPFVRGSTTTEGSGLGLAIASNIAGQMDAELHIVSPLPQQEQGFLISIRFPDVGIVKGVACEA
ncbi:HAMP domain-containing sensor histidine kinase [Komagataeibacter xylinus]|uniref:histidine kinase n=1 Tax=Komagataeibacter xylinus TaxID=28448 RepID=A0A857FQV6_KOMXY|nr:HAMP domain-containing sensor histidine kinase [Komagataeibacter xylinus]QHC36728.1 HAMP domain-containing histidine kinase [Komagataeibacter xylinus]